MKKFVSTLALILALASVMALASCRAPGNDGKQTTPPPADTTPAPVDTTPVETTPAPVETTTPAQDTTTPAETTTPIAPEDIVWTDANVTVYVSVNNAWLRKSPDLDDASRFVTLHLSDSLTCIGTSESWCKVTYGGETCYIANSCVTTDNISGSDFESVSDKVYVTVDSAWLRLGPSTDTEALSYTVKGAELTRIAKNASWSKVTIEDKTYYISNSCISETKPE